MNTIQDKERLPFNRCSYPKGNVTVCISTLILSVTSTWLFLQSCSSPPTCFCGANLLHTPITSHCDTESTWIHCPLSLSGGTSEALFSSSESDLIYSPSAHTKLSGYLGSSTFHLNIKAHEKMARHFKCHFCTALLSRNVTTEVLMTKGMSLEKQSLLCAAQPTHAHKTQETLIRKPYHFLDPKIGKNFDYCT